MGGRSFNITIGAFKDTLDTVDSINVTKTKMSPKQKCHQN